LSKQCQRCKEQSSPKISKSSNYLIFCSSAQILKKKNEVALIDKSKKSEQGSNGEEQSNTTQVKTKKSYFWVLFIPYAIVVLIAFSIMHQLFKKSKFYKKCSTKYQEYKEKMQEKQRLKREQEEKKKKIETPNCKFQELNNSAKREEVKIASSNQIQLGREDRKPLTEDMKRKMLFRAIVSTFKMNKKKTMEKAELSNKSSDKQKSNKSLPKNARNVFFRKLSKT
jgi:hypothetical protein